MSSFPPRDTAMLSWYPQGDVLSELLAQGRAEDVRSAWREIAEALDGFGAAYKPSGRRDAYKDIVGPGESKQMRSDMCSMSGCGLVAGCIFRCAGIRSPSLEPPYRIGWAVERLRMIALKAKALVVPVKGSREPESGDLYLVGYIKPPKPKDASDAEKMALWNKAVAEWKRVWGGEAHVATTFDNLGTTITVVEGGQVDAQFVQCIDKHEHQAEWRGAQLWIGGRRCQWFIDCTKLPYAAEWVLPVPTME